MSLGKKLKEARLAKGWDKKVAVIKIWGDEIHDSDDLDTTYLSMRRRLDRWENDENLPSPPSLSKMANAYGVSVDFLLGGLDRE